MERISPDCLRQLESALEAYAEEVEAADLADATKAAYLLHASSFVRWLQDGSGPCARLRSRDIHCRTVNPVRSDAVAGTWKDPRVAAARRRRHRVEVDGVLYRSFRAAALAAGVMEKDDNRHIAARGRCKREGRVEWMGKVFVLGPEY